MSQPAITRRQLLGGSAVLAGAAVLAACSSDDSASNRSTSSTRSTTSTVAPSASGGTGQLRLLTLPQFHNPANLDDFTKLTGAPVSLDIVDSDQEAIRHLHRHGSGYYDLVVISGSRVKQLAGEGMLTRIDHDQLPNLSGLASDLQVSGYDKGLRYSVPKSIGTTGYVWDKRVIPHGISSWDEFRDAATRPGVTGKVTMLADPYSIYGAALWAQDENVQGAGPAHMDQAATILVKELAPHLLALDSSPSERLLDGSAVLSQIWNGEARRVVQADPSRWGWALGSPRTSRWVDVYGVVGGTKQSQLAHSFINLMLEPGHSLAEMSTVGYDTGVDAARARVGELAYPDMIVFTDAQVATMVTVGDDPDTARMAATVARMRKRID